MKEKKTTFLKMKVFFILVNVHTTMAHNFLFQGRLLYKDLEF